MCGICGVLGNRLSKFEIGIFQDLMVVSTLRGAMGSGMVSVPVKPKQDIEVLRSLDSAAELSSTAEFLEVTKKPMTCLLGHARFPTRGGYTISESHPHQHGAVIGVHNGTMSVVDGKTITAEDSDSRLLIEAIANKGAKEAIAKSKGAYSLVWINKHDNTLSFLRNYERPIAMAKYEDDPTVLYWASEIEMLRFVLLRAAPVNAKLKLFTLNPDVCMTFHLRPGHGVLGYKHKELMLSDYKPPVTTVPITGPPDSVIDHSKSTTMLATKKGSYLTTDELHVCLGSGCAYCETPATMHDYHKGLYWIGTNEFVCRQCVKDDELARAYVESLGIRVTDKELN